MDINGDGRKDLIFGEGNNSNLNYYSRNDDGSLHFEGNLFQLPYDVNKEASPAFADMDNDGDLDLILGSKATWAGGARLFYFENSGSTTSYKFTTSVVIGKEGGVDGAKVTLTDLDGDGLKDIVFTVGYDGKCMFQLNTGTVSNPGFTNAAQVLTLEDGTEITSGTGIIPAETNLKPTFRVSVCDWNNDGTPDLLFGRSLPVVLYGPSGMTANSSTTPHKEADNGCRLISGDGNGIELVFPEKLAGKNKEINIYNPKGQHIMRKSFCSNSAAIGTLNLSSGLYIIEVLMGNQTSYLKLYK